MRDFHCPNCGQRLTFENSACLSCGSALGFSLEQMALLVIAEGDDGEHAGFVDADEYQLCANLHVAECNWLVPIDQSRRAVRVVRADRWSGPTTPTPTAWRSSPAPRRPSGG